MTYNGISFVCQNFSRPIVLRLVCLSLLVMILWQVIACITSIVSVNKMASQSMHSLSETKTLQHRSASHAGLKQAFFGNYVPKNLNDIDVKQSMLNVSVVGILFASDERNSQVILKMAGGYEKTFSVGDKVAHDAIIKRITAEGVLVERKGVLESLSFPKNELIFEDPAKPLIKDGLHAF